jgi:hypothetical protein
MGKLIDLTGKVFGRLAVLRQAETRSGNARWHCRCECGTERVVQGSHLRRWPRRSVPKPVWISCSTRSARRASLVSSFVPSLGETESWTLTTRRESPSNCGR